MVRSIILLLVLLFACDDQSNDSLVLMDQMKNQSVIDQYQIIVADQKLAQLDMQRSRTDQTLQDQQIHMQSDQMIPQDQQLIADMSSHQDRFHPIGYDAPLVHGLAFKQFDQDCRLCHGDQLNGGTSNVSCDRCHQQGWRTNCGYCHGHDAQGAPPRDLKNETDLARQTFKPHAQHLNHPLHGNWGCEQCHMKPTEVLSPAHVFDDTYGKAEVDFTQGLSVAGTYQAETGCANLYCHGNGRQVGSAHHDDPSPSCDTCHPKASLGGEHQRHFREGFSCVDCHQATANEQDLIATPEMHVNGQIDLQFKDVNPISPIALSFGTCNGICHGKIHFFKGWD
jgi:hypothetical protein